MVNIVLSALGLTLALAASPAAAFDMGMTLPELRSETGQYAVADLAVGEQGILLSLPLCRQGTELRTPVNNGLQPQAQEYVTTYRVAREPGDKLRVRTVGTSGALEERASLIRQVLGSFQCSYYEAAGVPTMAISTIDGFESLDEMLGD